MRQNVDKTSKKKYELKLERDCQSRREQFDYFNKINPNQLEAPKYR